MSLNCFKEGYHFLDNKSKKKEYLFIKEGKESLIKTMQDDLDDYDPEVEADEEKSAKS